MKIKFLVLLSILFFHSGIISIKAQISANEPLRAKLTQYVTEGKIFEKNKVEDFNKATEFGEFRGTLSAGNIYAGKNYSLIISFEDVDTSRKKILDFILEEKDRLCAADGSYSSCAIIKNFKKDSRGLITGDNACEGLSAVKLKTAETNCMTAIPIVKAWKKETDGKFVEVLVTGLTWCDECP